MEWKYKNSEELATVVAYVTCFYILYHKTVIFGQQFYVF